MSMYFALKRTYKLLPQPMRHAMYRMTPDRLRQVRLNVVHHLEDGAVHDEIYDSTYYAEKVEPSIRASAATMAGSIVRDFAPRNVADVGCGTGTLLAALQERGVEVKGYEYSTAGIELCRGRGLDVTRFDIEHDPVPDERFDLVISTEVAEHLPESCADRYLDILTALSNTVVLTAATPGQPGNDHVNLQPNEYWIDKLADRGFPLDQETTSTWRETWKDRDVHWIYHHSIMVFRRSG